MFVLSALDKKIYFQHAMIELPLEYMNKLANQIILISALLGGFSLAVIATLLESQGNNRMVNNIFRIATMSTAFFLVAIFSMTNILMRTTEGFPFELDTQELNLSRIIGTLSFFLGILGLIALVGMSGWTKSKRMGIFTTAIGILAFVLMSVMMA